MRMANELPRCMIHNVTWGVSTSRRSSGSAPRGQARCRSGPARRFELGPLRLETNAGVPALIGPD
jgi:hypothetical protein